MVTWWLFSFPVASREVMLAALRSWLDAPSGQGTGISEIWICKGTEISFQALVAREMSRHTGSPYLHLMRTKVSDWRKRGLLQKHEKVDITQLHGEAEWLKKLVKPNKRRHSERSPICFNMLSRFDGMLKSS